MKICLLTVGHFKSTELERLMGHYLKLASKFVAVETVALALPKALPEAQAQDQALLKFLERRGARAHLTILDERGKLFSSRELAGKIEKIKDASHSEWLIAVGGAHGYGPTAKEKADWLWSLSPLTLAHELATAVAAEQVFRALAILNKHPYHNE